MSHCPTTWWTVELWRLVLVLFAASTVLCQSSENYREGTFKVTTGAVLRSQVIETYNVRSTLECGWKCTHTSRCRSYNYQCGADTHLCQLNKKTKTMVPADYQLDVGFSYYEKEPCIPDPCLYGSQCVAVNDSDYYRCVCKAAYTGRHCQTERLGWFPTSPARSCKHIKDSGNAGADGPYFIDPENSGNPFQAYCDMTTDGGGWLLTANFVLATSQPPTFLIETSLRSISKYSNNRTGITSSAIRALRQLTSFTQMRFTCRKEQVGRTLHMITKPDEAGAAVVNFFTGQSNTLPASCNSYTRGTGDTSKLAIRCARWGNDGSHYVGKWGHKNHKTESRMYRYAAFEAYLYHWIIPTSTPTCDDKNSPASAGDYWKIYVR